MRGRIDPGSKCLEEVGTGSGVYAGIPVGLSKLARHGFAVEQVPRFVRDQTYGPDHLLRFRGRRVNTANLDPTGRRSNQPGEGVEQTRLAGAVAAHHGDYLARPEGK